MRSPPLASEDSHVIALLLCGYPADEAGEVIPILESSGQSMQFNTCPQPGFLPDRNNTARIHCALINADEPARTVEAFVSYLRRHRPETGLVLTSRTPQARKALAERLKVHDLIDVSERPRLQLVIRRMYLASHMWPQPPAGHSEPKPDRPSERPPDPDDLAVRFRPVVNLDGESLAHYIIFAPRGDVTDRAGAPVSGGSWRTLPLEHRLVHDAARLLASLGGKAGIQLYVSPESTQDESLLPAICESLRHFRVRGRNLHFCIDASSLSEEKPDLQHFVEGMQKINCRITCRGVDFSRTSPDLLSRYGVHMAQYRTSLFAALKQQPEKENELRDFNRQMQEKRIKTVAGQVEQAEQLARLWRTGVNKAWGDFLQPPQLIDSRPCSKRRTALPE